MMNDSRKHRWLLLLFAIGSLIATDEALAQSQSTTSKRSFAMLLARGARADRRPVPAAVVSGRTSRPAAATNHAAREGAARAPTVTSHVARAAALTPLTSGAVYGVQPATAVVPSGYGSGRDAYVEALYPQILGRQATQSDVDYWARVLYRGTQADVVAQAIWNSQEHKSLERSGQAPNIPLATAYRRAYAYGLLHCKEREAAERRRQEAEERRLEKE